MAERQDTIDQRARKTKEALFMPTIDAELLDDARFVYKVSGKTPRQLFAELERCRMWFFASNNGDTVPDEATMYAELTGKLK